MNKELQIQAKEFLKRTPPSDYVSGSMAENFIAYFAKKGKGPDDAEAIELIELCIMETENAIESRGGDEREYFEDSLQLLKSILKDTQERA